MVGSDKGLLRTKPETNLKHILDPKLMSLKRVAADTSKKNSPQGL